MQAESVSGKTMATQPTKNLSLPSAMEKISAGSIEDAQEIVNTIDEVMKQKVMTGLMDANLFYSFFVKLLDRMFGEVRLKY